MNYKMPRIFKTLFIFISMFILFSCATTPKETLNLKPTYVPRFDFSPPTEAQIGSAGVTFGLVSANYSEDKPWVHQWPFNKFSENMAIDFQELLIARGFTTKGPFRYYQEMTYPDKKSVDLILEPTLSVNLEVTDLNYKRIFMLYGPSEYTLFGNLILSGRVTLSIEESLSKERMWLKSIELPRTVLKWSGQKQYQMLKDSQGKEYVPKPSKIDFSDPGLTQVVGEPLEKFYIEILQTAWKYLEPEEMRLVKKQAQEVRDKKVY